MPYMSSTKANEVLMRRKKNKLRVFSSVKISLIQLQALWRIFDGWYDLPSEWVGSIICSLLKW
jgi:hypothetical protein